MQKISYISILCLSIIFINSCVYFNYIPINQDGVIIDTPEKEASNVTTVYEDENLSIDLVFLSDGIKWFPSYYSGIYFKEKTNINVEVEEVEIVLKYKGQTINPTKNPEEIITNDYNGNTIHNFYQTYPNNIKWYMKELDQSIYLKYSIDGKSYELYKSYTIKKVKSHTVWELLGSV